MTFTVLLTILVGLCYITLREKSTSNILNAFPKDDSLIIFCRILFAIDLCFTYPLEVFIVRDTIQKSIFGAKEFSPLRHYAITAAIVVSTTVIGCITCDLGLIIELTGGIGASLLAFIIPSACLLRVYQLRAAATRKIALGEEDEVVTEDLGAVSWVGHLTLILFGISVMLMTIVLNILNEMNGHGSKSCF